MVDSTRPFSEYDVGFFPRKDANADFHPLLEDDNHETLVMDGGEIPFSPKLNRTHGCEHSHLGGPHCM